MPCKTLRAQLPLFAGGELDAVQSAIVGQHLKSCDTCRRGAAAFSADRAQLTRYRRDLEQHQPAPDVMASLRERLAATETPDRLAVRAPLGRRRDEGFMA
jgi:anti-sigma factor ChrR (cupin superfamily)